MKYYTILKTRSIMPRISNSKFFQALAQTQVIKWISFSEKQLSPAVVKNIKPSRVTVSHPAENRKARVAENSPKP